MKVAFYAMLKNEQSIAPAFSEMLNEFADYIYLVDHESTDDTFNIIKNKTRKAKIYKLTSNRYPQSELSNFFARLIFAETDADFLFFLDADEFISFNTKQDLHTFLVSNADFHAIQVPWNNLSLKGDSFDGGFTSMGPSKNYSKIILSRSIRNISDYKISQGNHSIVSNRCSLRINNQKDVHLFHIPILSYTNLLIKLLNGIRSLENDATNKILNNGYHWYDIAKRVTTETLSQDQLNDIIYHYSDSIPEATKVEDLDFNFPYIKTRTLPAMCIDNLLLSYLADIVDTNSKNASPKNIDIMIRNDKDEVIYLKNRKVVAVFLRVIYYRLKLILPQPIKRLARKLVGQRC